MTSDISTETQQSGGTMGMSCYSRRYLRVVWRLTLTGMTLVLLSTPTAPLYAKDSEPMTATAINPALPGSRVGILTRAQGTMLFIDRTAYNLAPIAHVQDRFGTPLSIQDLQCNDAQYRVQYWTAPELGHDQIVQLIVTFPE
jgi:hypothetical protein